MQPKKSDRQRSFLCPDLLDQLDPRNHLLGLAKVIPWQVFEDNFRPLYAASGRPGKPVRLMVGLLILKQLENLSDERVVEAWVQNPYFQAFCGQQRFTWKLPCDPSELTYFRRCQRNSKSDPPLPIFGKLKLTHPTYSSACMTGIC